MKKKWFLWILLFVLRPIQAHELKKIITLCYLEEEVAGKIFMQQVNMVNGLTKKNWKIGDQEVAEDEFERSLAEAKAQEWINERKKEGEVRLSKQIELHILKNDIEKQDLRLHIKEVVEKVESIFDRFKGTDIETYYLYGPLTIASPEEFENLQNEVKKAKDILQSNISDLNLEEMQLFHKNFVPYRYKIEQFFLESVKNAVNSCSDTKALKAYLQLLS